MNIRAQHYSLLSIVLLILCVGIPSRVSASDLNSPVNADTACGLSASESAVLSLMREHPGQNRANIFCNPTLTQVARAKAKDMAMRGYVAHVDPDGHGANYLVTVAGYDLPDYYPKMGTANNIESLAAGYAQAGTVWQAWLNSQSHRVHVLGEEVIFAEQQQVGIGFYADPNSYYKEYWVVLSAPNE